MAIAVRSVAFPKTAERRGILAAQDLRRTVNFVNFPSGESNIVTFATSLSVALELL
jgi:hypothetical protein